MLKIRLNLFIVYKRILNFVISNFVLDFGIIFYLMISIEEKLDLKILDIKDLEINKENSIKQKA